MDINKMVKLSELSMSNYLVGQSLRNKSMVELKPGIKCAQYFLSGSELKPPFPGENGTEETLVVSEFESNKIVAIITEKSKKVQVKELADNLLPLGMTAMDNGNILAVIDQGVSGVPCLKYYTRDDGGKFSLIECLTKTTDGKLVSCMTGNDYMKYPENTCKAWKPKDIMVTKQGHLLISDISTVCENRLSSYSPDGRFVTSFGRACGPGESTFRKPFHITGDPIGRVYASDWENGNIQVFDSRGFWLNSIGESSRRNSSKSTTKNSQGNEEKLERPSGIGCDSFGNVIVCDVAQSRLVMFSNSGKFMDDIRLQKKSNKYSPSAIRISAALETMAVSYTDKKDSFKKFIIAPWKNLPHET